MIAQHVAHVLAQKAFDALAELLHPVDIRLLHAPRPIRRVRLARLEFRDLLFYAIVPGDVGHQIFDAREGVHRLDGHRLIERDLAQPRHAHQSRLAVDFRRARPAFSGLAVPAHRQIVRLRGLDAMHHVQHHHAGFDLGRVVDELSAVAYRRARFGTSRVAITCSPRSPVSVPSGIGFTGAFDHPRRPIRRFAHAHIAPRPLLAFLRIIVAEMRRRGSLSA